MSPGRTLFALPLFLAVTGCPVPLTGTGGPALTFEVREGEHGKWLEQPRISLVPLDGALRLEAELSTPDPCRSFEARAGRDAETLILEVTVRPQGEACVGIVGHFEYTAALSGLQPGTYEVRVVHAMLGTGDPSPRVVFEGVARVD